MILIDVGQLEEHEAMDYVNRWRKSFKKTEFVDPASANYAKQFNPITPLEDVYIPMRGENSSRVEKMDGEGNIGEVYDLDYFINKFFGTARIPKAYVGFEGDVNAKATLLQQDVRFARTCKAIRTSFLYGVRRGLDIHFALMTEDRKVFPSGTAADKYVVQMSPISYLDEFERLELVQLRYQIVEAMGRLAGDLRLDPQVWAAYVLTTFGKLPEDLVAKLIAKTGQDGGGEQRLEAYAKAKNMSPAEYERWRSDPEAMRMVFGAMPMSGFSVLTESEKRAVAEAVHRSSGLRQVLGDVARYYAMDLLIEQQTDPTTLPPTFKGRPVEDTVTDDKESQMLLEHMRELSTPVNDG
jgi:hypothetical protein